jgi:hypothetical protein
VVVGKSGSLSSSPVIKARKKKGYLLLCLDYRKLKDFTKKDCFPLPLFDGTLDNLPGAKRFCTMDLKSSYWQVDLHPDDNEKIIF